MSMGDRIKFLREQLGMTQEELGEKIGVQKAAIQKYEKGSVKNIKRSSIKIMCDLFNVSPSYLMGWDEDEEKVKQVAEETKFNERIQKQYGKQSVELLQAFNELNAQGRNRAVEAIIEISEIPRFQKNPAVPMRSIPVYNSPAAAGTPLYAESNYEYVDFPITEIPEGTDFGVRISGESMQPTIEDGSIIFVEKTVELHSGEIGVFMLNDSAVCKRLKLNAQGRVVALLSDNPEYDSITGYELEGFRVVGKVII